MFENELIGLENSSQAIFMLQKFDLTQILEEIKIA